MIELTPKNLRRYKIHLVWFQNKKYKKIINKKKLSLALVNFLITY